MADFIASMIAGIITLIVCALGLYASMLTFSIAEFTMLKSLSIVTGSMMVLFILIICLTLYWCMEEKFHRC
jgi:hypothetical protein